MRTTMRSKIPGHFAALCIAGLGRLWHCTQYRREGGRRAICVGQLARLEVGGGCVRASAMRALGPAPFGLLDELLGILSVCCGCKKDG